MSDGRFPRRDFLRHSAAAVGSAALAGTFQAFLGRAAHGEIRRDAPDYGKLVPVKDETTGLPLLQLPEGFRYVSYGWTGDKMNDGVLTPALHDGMAVIAAKGSRVTLCRNHEIKPAGRSFGPPEITYDRKGTGGCSNLTFDTHSGRWLQSWSSLAGTCRNCAGGPTPWGSWLSCEETVLSPGDREDGRVYDFERTHGWIFEVPAEAGRPSAAGGAADRKRPTAVAKPLKDMGRFVHEAIAVDPDTGYVYETEDRDPGGFYRFIPNEKGRLSKGGRLQMLKAAGRGDLRKGCRNGDVFEVAWVDIEDPYRAHSPGTTDEHGVYRQGKSQGATTFARLEGCWYGNGVIYFNATSGGDTGSGQVWEYDPRAERLRLLFESPGKDVLDSPDNLAVSPRGGIVLCEDCDTIPERLQGMTTDGRIFPFAVNNIILKGQRNGITGDFRREEWAGATFSPDGQWLFVNIQVPGITFAITGPWQDGGL